MADSKQERADEAVMSAAEAGEVEMPYSIYSGKEKWLIVGMVAMAGFYRYVPLSFSKLCITWISKSMGGVAVWIFADHDVVHYLRTSTSQLYRRLQMRLPKASMR